APRAASIPRRTQAPLPRLTPASRTTTGTARVGSPRTTSAGRAPEPSMTTSTSAVQRPEPRYSRMRSRVGPMRRSSLNAGITTLRSTRALGASRCGRGGAAAWVTRRGAHLRQEVVHGDRYIRERDERETAPPPRDLDQCVPARRRVGRPVHLHVVLAEVDDPVLGDAGGGVDRRLREAVLGQRAYRHLDHE